MQTTDHKQILKTVSEKTSLLGTAASGLQRWAIILSEYRYCVEHISDSQSIVAEGLSCLPLKLTRVQDRSHLLCSLSFATRTE